MGGVTDDYPVGHTFDVKVPADAAPGSSRLRIVFSDAWFPHPGPAGLTQKGFAIDVPMMITGTNPGREAAADTHDAGVADEPENLLADRIIAFSADALCEAVALPGGVSVEHADKVWLYTADGRNIGFAAPDGQKTVLSAPAGMVIVRMQQGSVIRSAKLFVQP